MRYLLMLSMLLMTSACFDDKEKQVEPEAQIETESTMPEPISPEQWAEEANNSDGITGEYVEEVNTGYNENDALDMQEESAEDVIVGEPATAEGMVRMSNSNNFDNLNFTAGGNEPGWRIVVKDGQVEITRNYGQDVEIIALPENSSDDEMVRIFNMQNANGENVTIQIQKAYCQDTMSGKEFEHKATLVYGAESLTGCGFMEQMIR